MFEVRSGPAIGEATGDALLVGVGTDRTSTGSAAAVMAALGEAATARLDAADFTGKPGQVVVLDGGATGYPVVVLVGVGEEPEIEELRRAAGSAAGAVARSATVGTTLHELAGGGGDAAGAVVMGLVLGQYRFDRHRSEPKPSLTERVDLLGGDGEAVAGAAEALVVADAVILARDLVNEAPVAKPPAAMAETAMELTDLGVRVRVYDEAEIREEGFGGLAGVAAGAANPPRMVEMWWEPPGATAFLALVGKGIVFDSGGLSLKPAEAMETMKTDMAGAAAVIGAMQAIARLEIPVRVLGITPLTENMPGGAALRPGDVLRARNGKTIEVLNTDAEGRLVLADGLSLAAEAEPDLIVDIATLTGACKIALGDHIAGVMGTDDGRRRVEEAAEAAGERVWPLPLPDDYRKKIDSDIADMKNTGPRWGGAINAGLLLREFVGELPWAHLDIAGPARSPEASGYINKGGTGFGVRTLVAVARAMAGD